jgi:hypothetical protein
LKNYSQENTDDKEKKYYEEITAGKITVNM